MENPSIYQALALAKNKFQAVKREAEAKLGSYSYKYATLDDMIAATQPALSTEGLVVSHSSEVKEGRLVVTATLYGWGGMMASVVELPLPADSGRTNPAQAFGGVLTYGRRYSYAALLGIPVEDDTDAGHVDYKAPETSARGARSDPPAKSASKPVESAATALSGLIKDSVDGGKISKDLGARLWQGAKSIKMLAESTGAAPDFSAIMAELNAALEDYAEKAANPDLV